MIMGPISFYCILYAGGLVFLAGCVVRAVCYARQPLHLRWEIYPVPKGNSGELRVMVPEILFLKGLWEFNRPMWYVSYPFHLGLYLLASAAFLLGCRAAAPDLLSALLHPVCLLCAGAGAILALAGSLGLLARRTLVRELRQYSSPGDFLNLVLFVVTLVLLMAGYLTRPAGSAGAAAILRGAASFDTKLPLPALFCSGLAAAALLLAYIPMTHMSHFIAKYFTYHQVRWDERENARGGSIEKRMAEYLMYRPTWSAPHIAAEGRTWAEIATSNPAKGVPR